jgi:hypothetical protein
MEKTRTSKIIAIMLCVSLCFACAGCAGPSVAKVNGEKISDQIFNYYFYIAKSNLSSQYDFNDENFLETGKINNEAPAEYVKKQALSQVARVYAIKQEAVKAGLELTDTDKEDIQNSLNSSVDQNGGQEAYEKILSEVGLTSKGHLELLTLSKYEEKYYN